MPIKLFLRRWIDRLSILKQYFLRGHNSWFALAFAIMNFTIIFYQLLFKNLGFVPEFLKSYLVFFVVFGVLYFPLATIIGFLDFRKGTFSAEQNLQKDINPVWKELFARLNKIEHDNQEIMELLQKISDT